MTQLRTTVLMKTDIAGSTPHFRALLASDLQAVVSAHRALIERLAADEQGRIFKAGGDGYWLDPRKHPCWEAGGIVRRADAPGDR